MRDYADDLAVHMIETLYTQDEDKLNQMLDDDMLGWWLLTGAGRQLRLVGDGCRGRCDR